MRNSNLKIIESEELALEKSKKYTVYQFVHYFDVWGNTIDGYEVNNLCKENIFIIGDSWEFDDTIKYLKSIEFLSKRYKFVDLYGDGTEISHCKGMPIGRFQESIYDELPCALGTMYTSKDYSGSTIMYKGTVNIAICKDIVKNI